MWVRRWWRPRSFPSSNLEDSPPLASRRPTRGRDRDLSRGTSPMWSPSASVPVERLRSRRCRRAGSAPWRPGRRRRGSDSVSSSASSPPPEPSIGSCRPFPRSRPSRRSTARLPSEDESSVPCEPSRVPWLGRRRASGPARRAALPSHAPYPVELSPPSLEPESEIGDCRRRARRRPSPPSARRAAGRRAPSGPSSLPSAAARRSHLEARALRGAEGSLPPDSVSVLLAFTPGAAPGEAAPRPEGPLSDGPGGSSSPVDAAGRGRSHTRPRRAARRAVFRPGLPAPFPSSSSSSPLLATVCIAVSSSPQQADRAERAPALPRASAFRSPAPRRGAMPQWPSRSCCGPEVSQWRGSER